MRKKLKLFRVEKDLTQGEMAEKIGCSRAAYCGIESGSRDGKQAFWEDLQKAFDIPDSEMWALRKNE